jgi:hypothetical protein
MGTDTIKGTTISEIKKFILRDNERNGYKTIAKYVSKLSQKPDYDCVFWNLLERGSRKCIIVSLLKSSKNNGIESVHWKSLSAESHPYYYDCPLEWIFQIDTKDIPESWLEGVRNIWAALEGLEIGKEYKIYDGRAFKFLGWFDKSTSKMRVEVAGKVYRMGFDMLDTSSVVSSKALEHA